MSSFLSRYSHRSNGYLDRVKVITGDIAEQDVDAVFSLIPSDLEYRGQINHSLLKRAGAQLDDFILEHVINPRPGDVYAAPGFGLPSKHIFFAVVPVWRADFERLDRHLLNACRRSIELCISMSLKTIAIPPLASGKHGFPVSKAARLIVQALRERLDDRINEVRIVCRDRKAVRAFESKLFKR